MDQAENPWGGLCAQAKMALPPKITTLVHLDWDITKLKVLMSTQKNQGKNGSLFFKAMVKNNVYTSKYNKRKIFEVTVLIKL